MLDPWIHFGIVVLVQFLFFIAHAYSTKKLADVPRMFIWGALIGITVGIPFDLVVGKFFGLHSFTLGFGVVFLTINATFSYGLFVANTLLMQNVRLSYFFLWSSALMAIYEITNHFFHVWTWEFALPHFEFVAILLVGYFSGAILAAVIAHIFLGHRFFFISNKV